MRSYSIQNYIRYREDLKAKLRKLPDKPYNEYNRDELLKICAELLDNNQIEEAWQVLHLGNMA